MPYSLRAGIGLRIMALRNHSARTSNVGRRRLHPRPFLAHPSLCASRRPASTTIRRQSGVQYREQNTIFTGGCSSTNRSNRLMALGLVKMGKRVRQFCCTKPHISKLSPICLLQQRTRATKMQTRPTDKLTSELPSSAGSSAATRAPSPARICPARLSSRFRPYCLDPAISSSSCSILVPPPACQPQAGCLEAAVRL